jgi:hypothetical protein
MEIDTSLWSGEGTFTERLLDSLRLMPELAAVRVENAPASRSEADYNFISNEIFVLFQTRERHVSGRRFGVLPTRRVIAEKSMTLEQLAERLAGDQDIGAPDYTDEGMVQYLRAERIVPPYQTRGYKQVEMVRLYEAGTARRSG